jgi:hypothetical protein
MNRRTISMLLGLGIFLLMVALKALQAVDQVG